MYEVIVKKQFSAAHLLKEIDGKYEELHGHNFGVEVGVASAELNPDGILIDFRIVKKWLDGIIKALDHRYLNDVECFNGLNPSAEIIAKTIYDGITKKARRQHLEISRVTVWESEGTGATYYGNER
jgi:6-pyruvoyltetrahydropterin/6-carboxytetrahydropterin synthase